MMLIKKFDFLFKNLDYIIKGINNFKVDNIKKFSLKLLFIFNRIIIYFCYLVIIIDINNHFLLILLRRILNKIFLNSGEVSLLSIFSFISSKDNFSYFLISFCFQ